MGFLGTGASSLIKFLDLLFEVFYPPFAFLELNFLILLHGLHLLFEFELLGGGCSITRGCALLQLFLQLGDFLLQGFGLLYAGFGHFGKLFFYLVKIFLEIFLLLGLDVF